MRDMSDQSTRLQMHIFESAGRHRNHELLNLEPLNKLEPLTPPLNLARTRLNQTLLDRSQLSKPRSPSSCLPLLLYLGAGSSVRACIEPPSVLFCKILQAYMKTLQIPGSSGADVVNSRVCVAHHSHARTDAKQSLRRLLNL